MANYVRINQTEILETAPEAAHVLLEDNGLMKRIPASSVPVIQTATVGQTIAVKAVDENGKPTEWEAADMASGGGVAFIALNRPTPVVWDASSNQYVELTKDRFIELFDSGVIRVMDADLGDPTDHSHVTSTVQGTVVSYWINDTVANVGVSGMNTDGYYLGNIAAWI